jgi:type IV pilus assembly protein PilC
MAEWVMKYADGRGEIHHQVVEADTETELREQYSSQGYLIYSIKPRSRAAPLAAALGGRKKKLNVEKFLIFNQQFVTLVRAGLPILKSLELLTDRLTDAKLAPLIAGVRDEVRSGTLLSDAFRRQGVFPPIYVTSVMAGEKSGSLAEVLDRFITYQKLALAVRKKIMLSLLYPSFLVVLVLGLIVFLVTYVVPNFAQLYSGMGVELPGITRMLIAVGTTARNYILLGIVGLVAAGIGLRIWSQKESAKDLIDKIKLRTPVFGDVWIKYNVAQLARVLGTLLIGGIPLVQAMETAGDSLGTALLRKSIEKARRMVREGQSLSSALSSTKIFPGLAIDMIEVGESTGALPAMLASVAEFFEDDVNTRMTASLALIEPAIMICMGIFVAFVLIALYLPIFSLASSM